MPRDYYEALGVGREASAQQIKSAYRKIAVKFHPDKNPGDQEAEERFKEAAEAYAVLSDPEKRARYDRFGRQGVGSPPGGFDPSTFADFSDVLGDLFGFGDLFGGGRRGGARGGGPTPSPGADLRYDLTLTFEEAATGVSRELRIPRLEVCPDCTGSGARRGSAPVSCSACGGRGQVRFSQGFLTVARTCPQCRGEGTIVRDPCPGCRGQGRVERERTLEVKIPAGVDSGARMRLTGEGEHGRHGGPRGDLYVVLEVEPHASWERDGADVHARLEVSFPQATLGATLTVETLAGEQSFELPGGSQPGDQFRLRGKGFPRLGAAGRGDHVLHVAVKVPRPGELTEEQGGLLRRLAELEGEAVHEERGVLDRVKEFFS